MTLPLLFRNHSPRAKPAKPAAPATAHRNRKRARQCQILNRSPFWQNGAKIRIWDVFWHRIPNPDFAILQAIGSQHLSNVLGPNHAQNPEQRSLLHTVLTLHYRLGRKEEQGQGRDRVERQRDHHGYHRHRCRPHPDCRRVKHLDLIHACYVLYGVPGQSRVPYVLYGGYLYRPGIPCHHPRSTQHHIPGLYSIIYQVYIASYTRSI